MMSGQNMQYLKLSRKELKERFKAGRMPTEEDFMSLIDSLVNSVDEGFDVDEENGLQVKQKKDSGCLASFFVNLTEHRPQWLLKLRKNVEKGESSLNVKTPNMGPDESGVTIVSPNNADGTEPKVRVGVGNAAPRCELDVDGLIASKGRVGAENPQFEIIADGEWHNVTDVLTGCNCFEIVAGVGGNEGDGRFALAHAIAVNVFNEHPTVEITQSYSGGRGSKIDIRWRKGENKYEYTLQMRVRHKFDKTGKIKVRYHITKLWYDTQMIGSIVK